MRTLSAILFAVLVFLSSANPATTQRSPTHVDVEVEPVAYILGGAGGHIGVQIDDWSYILEVFGLEIPEALHGNDGFEASPLGVELHAERFFGHSTQGFYAGPEVGVTQLEVTHRASGQTERPLRYSVGVRAGYRWYPGPGDLYLSPVVGLGYTLNGDPIEIDGHTFDSGPLTPWGTVGIGWSF